MRAAASRCYHVGVGFDQARGSSVVSNWLPQVFRLLTDLHDLCSQSDLDMERFVTSALVSYITMSWGLGGHFWEHTVTVGLKHLVIKSDFNYRWLKKRLNKFPILPPFLLPLLKYLSDSRKLWDSITVVLFLGASTWVLHYARKKKQRHL